MRRLIEIAEKDKYDEFKVEINSKLEVIFDQKIYRLTDDDIVDPSEILESTDEITKSEVG